jgi:hypothetical protein
MGNPISGFMPSHAHKASIGSSTAASDVLTLPSSLDDFSPASYTQRTGPGVATTASNSHSDLPAISAFNFQETPDLTSRPAFSRLVELIPRQDIKSAMKEGDKPPKTPDDTQKKISRDASRRRTMHFEDQFAYKENWESVTAEDIRSESPVVLELRTNVRHLNLHPHT